ncbi:MAG: sn-glycerol-3-phosphate ABC transporter ATP-binding protein UgpC [Firmicutes bacterium]|nr:sn-glycerol-3-phosphate ABC transporter ATP-binding protein UgpC [Bacillota bacterium]
MASVQLDHVSKRFGAVAAVQDVTLDIADQEFLVLLGPSGCGKTTTLRMVAGLEELTEGRIQIGDRDVSHLPPKDRDIAMVFQNYALYPHMTVYENMAFGLKLHRTPKAEIDRRVKEAAAILGLEGLLTRRPKELSGGQRQRVALGRAIVREPKAFLMDEPLSNLDAKLRTQTRVELKRLHQRLGATIIYVTHDQTEAMTLGTRIVVMKDGVVQQVDTPEGIYHRPANVFVATFVGTPAMNIVDATIERHQGQLAAVIDGQKLLLSGPLAAALESWGRPTVRLGIRPEDISVGVPSDPPGPSVDAVVRLVEPMGHENLVYTDVGSANVVVRTGNDWTGGVGDRVTLYWNPQRIHAFDPESERSLLFS